MSFSVESNQTKVVEETRWNGFETQIRFCCLRRNDMSESPQRIIHNETTRDKQHKQSKMANPASWIVTASFRTSTDCEIHRPTIQPVCFQYAVTSQSPNNTIQSYITSGSLTLTYINRISVYESQTPRVGNDTVWSIAEWRETKLSTIFWCYFRVQFSSWGYFEVK